MLKFSPRAVSVAGEVSAAGAVVTPSKFAELQLLDQCTRARCIELVQQTLLEVEEATFTNLLRVHYRYLV